MGPLLAFCVRFSSHQDIINTQSICVHLCFVFDAEMIIFNLASPGNILASFFFILWAARRAELMTTRCEFDAFINSAERKVGTFSLWPELQLPQGKIVKLKIILCALLSIELATFAHNLNLVMKCFSYFLIQNLRYFPLCVISLQLIRALCIYCIATSTTLKYYVSL